MFTAEQRDHTRAQLLAHAEADDSHHWHLGAGGTSVIHVFLLPTWGELDITFAPESESGARGPT
ncbi:hypothetical protein AB0I69_34080 [Streptomyces sp. NPDC050508]|uniref:hypothetical protein n=1 Tax=Streptomyces sp. NPDC050508 TaxID=3155405 RepID=UPI0034156722